MTNTSRFAAFVEPCEDQFWKAIERTEQQGPEALSAMCDTGRWGELKECFESQGSMRVLLPEEIGEPRVRYAADLVHVYIDDELNIGGEDGVAPWAGPEGDESWRESDWEGRTYKTVYVIRNCIPIDPIPIDNLRKHDGGFLNGEPAACAIVQEATVVPRWEPPEYALSSDVLDGSFAVKTSAKTPHIEEAAERTKLDGSSAKTALVDPHVWIAAEQLLKKPASVRVYFVEDGTFGGAAQVKHVAELVHANSGDAYETKGKAALREHGPSVDPDPEWNSGEGKTVYVVKNCVRVLSFPVDKLVKRDGDQANDGHLQYTIVKGQKLTTCGGPAKQQETNVEPVEVRSVHTSAPQDSDAETDPPLRGEQDMSTATDGAKTRIVVNKYERNRTNRTKCIKAHGGPKCQVCEMTFAQMYGQHGAGYIHVHHVTPLSDVEKEHKPDVFNDLKPVCPNCHAMLHQKKADGTCYTLEELETIVKNCRSVSSELSIVEDRAVRTSRVSSLPPTGQA